MNTPKKTRAEIQREYRQRLLERNADETREKERKRWHTRRTLKKVKCIADISERSQRITRSRWRKQKAVNRAEKKRLQTLTPPISGDSISNGKSANKLKNANRCIRAYRQTVMALENDLESEMHSTEKYKKRWLRLRLSVSKNESTTSTAGSASTNSSIDEENSIWPEAGNETARKEVIKSCHKSHGNGVDLETKKLIETFLTRDDNSRVTTGKKQTVTKRKDKRQKCLLLDSLVNLHEKFCAEHSDNNVSYVTFTRHRPFWVRQPTAKDRDTCLCKKHENIQLAADKLHQLGVLKKTNIEELLKQVCCDINSRECMFRECEVCLTRRIVFDADGLLKNESTIVWFEWDNEKQEYEKDGQKKTAKVTRKCVKRGTLKELKTKLCDSVRDVLGRHVYTIRHQFRAYKHLKETLDPEHRPSSSECR